MIKHRSRFGLRRLGLSVVLMLNIIGKGRAADISDEFSKFPHDVAYVVTSPLRLDSYNWVVVPIAASALGITMAYDGTLRDRLIRLREWSGSKRLRTSGDALQFSGVALGVGLVAYGKMNNDDSAFDKGWMQLEGGATAGSVGFLLKWVVGRARPGGDDADSFKPFSSAASFPSGHTLMAFTAAEIASQEYPTFWVQIPSYLVATSVGVSRIAADQHWVGDVLASAILGTGIGHALFKVHHSPSKDWHLVALGNGIEVVYNF